jgi:hypothetical protein
MNLRDLFLRVRALVAPRRVEHELDEELAFHIEYDTQRHIANGLSAADARARALARFGPVSLVADRCRDARGTALIDDLARDVLYAFRTFRRAPLAAFTIVATVALGLGLVAAVFTFFNAFLRRCRAKPRRAVRRRVADRSWRGFVCTVHPRGIRSVAPRDPRFCRCRCQCAQHRNTHRGPPGEWHPGDRELLPRPGRPGGARAHVDAR